MKDKRIAILFLTIFIDLLGFGIVIPILPNLAKTMAITSHMSFNPDYAVGIIAAAFSVIQFLFAPMFGSLSDRIGRRPIILGSILVNAIGYFIFGIAGNFLILLISRIISGFGSANISAAQAYIADITTPADRAKKMGIIGAAFGLGFVFGPPIGGYLFLAGGLYYVGIFTAVLCLFNFVLAFMFLPESNTNKSAHRRKASDTFKGMFQVWNIEVIGELFLINFIYIMAFSMMQVNGSVLWKEKYGLNEKEVGNIFGMIGVAGAIVQGLLIGVFSKKLGLKKMLLIGCPLVGIGLAIIPLPPNIEWFYINQTIAIILLSVGNGLLMTSINSLVSINSPAHAQGTMLGTLQSLSSLSRVVGPLIASFLYAQSKELPFVTAGVFMFGIFFLAIKLSKKLKSENISHA
jgi:DHA1 family tetracycline resistance protein-like MFS transporter